MVAASHVGSRPGSALLSVRGAGRAMVGPGESSSSSSVANCHNFARGAISGMDNVNPSAKPFIYKTKHKKYIQTMDAGSIKDYLNESMDGCCMNECWWDEWRMLADYMYVGWMNVDECLFFYIVCFLHDQFNRA